MAHGPVQLQYMTHKTANASVLGEDRNNIMLSLQK